MREIIIIIQAIVSVALIVLILMQARGTGLGRTFGMGGGTSFSRRGLEKLLFKLTFVVSAIFLLVSVFNLLY